ncbi:MAG: VWA domain-containing protein, partial [Desulfarculaceae bacterium]
MTKIKRAISNNGFLACALLAVFLLAPPTAAWAGPDETSLLFILDCSGSMWGRVEAKPKIAIAKSVLQDLVDQVPDKVQIGLLAYGHRRKGDCKDLELIHKLGASKAEIKKALGTLSAKGKTPISGSLLEAGKLLTGRESETTLVLVSDGLETCGGDPCQVAEKLRAQGIKVVIHVVGFDVDSKTADQLKCIAQAGGGRYFQADKVQDLKDALGQVKAAVVEKKPLPPAPKAAEPAKVTSKSKRIRIAGPGTVIIKPASWVKMPPRYWALLDVESGKRKARTAQSSTKVKAGEYQIAWRQSEHGHMEVILNEVVKVESGKKVEVPIDTGLRLSVPKGIQPPKWWELREPGQNKAAARFHGTLDPQVVPAGTYHLFWRQVEHGARTMDMGAIEIQSGKLNDHVVDSGLSLQPADWVGKNPYYYALLGEKRKRVGSWNSFTPQLAPPGKYTLLLRPTQHNHSEIIWGPVEIPQHGFASVPINSGLKFIHEKGAKPPYRII